MLTVFWSIMMLFAPLIHWATGVFDMIQYYLCPDFYFSAF